jgi:hypothetical protein
MIETLKDDISDFRSETRGHSLLDDFGFDPVTEELANTMLDNPKIDEDSGAAGIMVATTTRLWRKTKSSMTRSKEEEEADLPDIYETERGCAGASTNPAPYQQNDDK